MLQRIRFAVFYLCLSECNKIHFFTVFYGRKLWHFSFHGYHGISVVHSQWAYKEKKFRQKHSRKNFPEAIKVMWQISINVHDNLVMCPIFQVPLIKMVDHSIDLASHKLTLSTHVLEGCSSNFVSPSVCHRFQRLLCFDRWKSCQLELH